jgi:hypothetical protein
MAFSLSHTHTHTHNTRVFLYGPLCVCDGGGRALQLPAHAYYRWRLYSIAQGDTPDRWRTDPFHLFSNGPVWVPPPLPTARGASTSTRGEDPRTSTSSTSTTGGGGGGGGTRPALAAEEREQLQRLLLHLTMERRRVGELMMFAVDHVDAADEVSAHRAYGAACGALPPSHAHIRARACTRAGARCSRRWWGRS